MGIGSFIKRQVQSFTSGITAQDGVQDWQHAAKVFTAEDMIRSPKFKGMFHVNFVFNTEAFKDIPEAQGFIKAIADNQHRDLLSVLTKSIELPKFSIENTEHNQYNKATHTFKKIKYDPVSVSFHDDMSDIVWAFWAFYYNWYFSDGHKGKTGILDPGPSSQPENKKVSLGDAFRSLWRNTIDQIGKIFDTKEDALISTEKLDGLIVPKPGSEWETALNNSLLLNSDITKDTWSANWTSAWGLNGSPYHATSGGKNKHLLKAIEIFPLGNKQASVIVLHNPKIVKWSHDTFDYSQTTTASCTMELVYEGVTYMDQMSAADVLADIQLYDRHSSPLMRGAPRSFLGQGGFLDRSAGIIGNVLNGKAGLGDIINAAGLVKSLSSKRFRQGVASELGITVRNAVESSAVSAVSARIYPTASTVRSGNSLTTTPNTTINATQTSPTYQPPPVRNIPRGNVSIEEVEPIPGIDPATSVYETTKTGARIVQAPIYAGNSSNSKYINQVTIAEDGTMAVIPNAVVRSNQLTGTTTTTTTPVSNINQLTGNNTVTTAPPTTVGSRIVIDPQGNRIRPLPPGPPG